MQLEPILGVAVALAVLGAGGLVLARLRAAGHLGDGNRRNAGRTAGEDGDERTAEGGDDGRATEGRDERTAEGGDDGRAADAGDDGRAAEGGDDGRAARSTTHRHVTGSTTHRHVTDDDCARMRRHLRKPPSQRSPDDLLPADDADDEADVRER